MLSRTLVLTSIASSAILLSNPVFAQTDETPIDPPEDTMTDDTMTDDTMSDDTMSDDTMSDDTMSDDTMSDDTMSDDTMSDDTMSDDTMSDDTMSDDTMSDDTMSDDTMTDDTMSDDTMSDDTMDATDAEPTSLADLAAADENLELIEGENGEADAMVMMADVLFNFGSATLSDDALASLQGLADHLDEYPTVEIYGYTDAVGSESANEALGLRRADSVGDWLAANSEMPAERILTSSLGENDPVAANQNDDGTDNPEGRALNRRVVFLFPDM